MEYIIGNIQYFHAEYNEMNTIEITRFCQRLCPKHQQEKGDGATPTPLPEAQFLPPHGGDILARCTG